MQPRMSCQVPRFAKATLLRREMLQRAPQSVSGAITAWTQVCELIVEPHTFPMLSLIVFVACSRRGYKEFPLPITTAVLSWWFSSNCTIQQSSVKTTKALATSRPPDTEFWEQSKCLLKIPFSTWNCQLITLSSSHFCHCPGPFSSKEAIS